MEVEAPKKKKKKKRRRNATASEGWLGLELERTRPRSPVLMPPPPERPAVVMNFQEGRQQLLEDISESL
jgi:hypothetical protein